MLRRKDIIDTRLEASNIAGLGEQSETTPSESFELELALEAVRGMSAHKQEVAANWRLINDFVHVIAPEPTNQSWSLEVPLGNLERAKQLQSSLVWQVNVGKPYFMVGSHATPKQHFTDLLLVPYPVAQEEDTHLSSYRVSSDDLEAARGFKDVVLQEGYSSDDILRLTDVDHGVFRITREHPRSVKLRQSDPACPGNAFNLFWGRVLSPDIRNRGIRAKTYGSYVTDLTDQMIEEYRVLDSLADLARTFHKEAELQALVAT